MACYPVIDVDELLLYIPILLLYIIYYIFRHQTTKNSLLGECVNSKDVPLTIKTFLKLFFVCLFILDFILYIKKKKQFNINTNIL